VKNTKAVLYGYSTEGITLVNTMLKNEPFMIVDENTRFANSYEKNATNTSFNSDIIDLIPADITINGASFIFFGPKLKVVSDWPFITFHLKYVAGNINKGQHFINLLPVEIGKNEQMIEIIEAVSGLRAGKDFGFHYFPVGSPSVLASSFEGKKESWMGQTSDLNRAEERFLLDALDAFTEKFRKVWLKGKAQIFYSYYVKGYYTLSLIPNSFGKNSPLSGLSKIYMKSAEDFALVILDKIKERVKSLSIKPTKASVYIVWDIDTYEMLGESEYFRAKLIEKLNEFFSQTKLLSIERLESYILNYQLTKEELLLICDEIFENRIKDKVDAQKIIRATV